MGPAVDSLQKTAPSAQLELNQQDLKAAARLQLSPQDVFAGGPVSGQLGNFCPLFTQRFRILSTITGKLMKK